MSYVDKLREAKHFKADWNRKAQRLYELVMQVDSGQQLRVDVEEANTNYLLVNITLKVASLVNSYRRARVQVYGVDLSEAIGRWFNDFVKDGAIYDIEDVLKDRFVTGIGVIGLVVVNDRVQLQRIDPLDVFWESGSLRRPRWVIRRVWRGDEEPVYEYWDADTHAFFSESSVLYEGENPLGFIPYRFLLGFSVPRVAFPVGDVELAYPQQVLLNEIRRVLLDHARRGAGFFEVRESDAEPFEFEKLLEPGEVIIRTSSGQAVRPLPTPPLNAEWLQLEAVAKNDLDAQSGVSEYLRGSMPMANNIQFATQVLAALGAQNLRIQADWVPVAEAIEWASYGWFRWARYNGEVRKIGDILVDLSLVDSQAIGFRVVSDVEQVSEIGISPEVVAQAGLKRG